MHRARVCNHDEVSGSKHVGGGGGRLTTYVFFVFLCVSYRMK